MRKVVADGAAVVDAADDDAETGKPGLVTSSRFSTTMRLLASVELLNMEGGGGSVVGVVPAVAEVAAGPVICGAGTASSSSIGGGMKTGVIRLRPSTVRVSICLSIGPKEKNLVISSIISASLIGLYCPCIELNSLSDQ